MGDTVSKCGLFNGLSSHSLFVSCLTPYLDNPSVCQKISEALDSTDQRIADQSSVNPAFLWACFLWAPWQAKPKQAFSLLKESLKSVRLPQRLQEQVLFIWRAQALFHRSFGKRNADIAASS